MKSASRHWVVQRLTAIALIPLTIWFLVSLFLLPDMAWLTVRSWIAAPLNAFLLGSMVVILCWHSLLGIQVVVEDYIHHRVANATTLLMSTFLHILTGAAALLSVLKIASGVP
jgi:succinate dehydrogenase / fumarate reductase, membrane anchor subunit